MSRLTGAQNAPRGPFLAARPAPGWPRETVPRRLAALMTWRRQRALAVALCALFGATSVAGCGSVSPDAPPVPAPVPTPVPPPTGLPSLIDSPSDGQHAEARGLFLTACAACHGADGSGRGTTELDRPARSFLLGGFSFGNTPDAVARTITFGIPGTPMPAFREAYGERERHLLAEYILSLGPERSNVDATHTLMVVGDTPVVARGILPSIAEGAPLRPRGLLIGTPAGLSFEYRIDDVRLLGVRQGDFAARDDWIGRGGSPLRPLGTLVQLLGDGNPPPTFSSNGEPLHARFTGTTVDDDGAAVLYRLERQDGVVQAYVEERITPWTREEGSGWTRSLHLVSAGLDAVPLDVLALPPHAGLDMRDVHLVEWIVLPWDGGAVPNWFSVAGEGEPDEFMGASAQEILDPVRGRKPNGSWTLGVDGLGNHFDLRPERQVEVRHRTFFPSEKPESKGHLDNGDRR